MTLRERLHHQIDQLDAHQLAAIEMLLAQMTRQNRPQQPAQPTAMAPYLRAQRLMTGQQGFAQDIIDSRADRA